MLAGKMDEPNMAMAMPIPPPPPLAPWGVEQFVVRTDQLVEQPYGSRVRQRRHMLSCLHYDMSAHPYCVRLCVAGAPGPPRTNRKRAMTTFCASDEDDALALAPAQSQESCDVTPRRRGAAVRSIPLSVCVSAHRSHEVRWVRE